MRKAFTIVELLVVMAVIGILISLAVVGIQAIQRSQRETSRQNDLRNFQTKLEEFYSKYRFYPSSDGNNWVAGNGNQYNYVRVDNTGNDQGLCLMVPGSQALSSGRWATLVCDVAVSNSNYFSTIKFSQNGISSTLNGWNNGSGYYTGLTCDTTNGNSETWTLMYGTPPGSDLRQQYRLSACTENGKYINMGTFD